MAEKRLLVSLTLFVIAACAPATDDAPRIEAERLSNIVKVLASDEFEGRAPGTAGEQKTVAYLIQEFEKIGVEPGGENGGWTQSVPLFHTLIEDPPPTTSHLPDAACLCC